jgi:hypothetical protein
MAVPPSIGDQNGSRETCSQEVDKNTRINYQLDCRDTIALILQDLSSPVSECFGLFFQPRRRASHRAYSLELPSISDPQAKIAFRHDSLGVHSRDSSPESMPVAVI